MRRPTRTVKATTKRASNVGDKKVIPRATSALCSALAPVKFKTKSIVTGVSYRVDQQRIDESRRPLVEKGKREGVTRTHKEGNSNKIRLKKLALLTTIRIAESARFENVMGRQ